MEIGLEKSDLWPQYIIVDDLRYDIEYECREPTEQERHEGPSLHIWLATTVVNGKKVFCSYRNAFESAAGLADEIVFLTGSTSKRVCVDLPISRIKRNAFPYLDWSR